MSVVLIILPLNEGNIASAGIDFKIMLNTFIVTSLGFKSV